MTNDELDSLRLSAEQGDADARPPVDTFRYPAPSTAPVTHDGNEAVQTSSAGNASTPRQNEYRDMRGNGGSVAYNAFEYERKSSIIDKIMIYCMCFKRTLIDRNELKRQDVVKNAGESVIDNYSKLSYSIRAYTTWMLPLILPIAAVSSIYMEITARYSSTRVVYFFALLLCAGAAIWLPDWKNLSRTKNYFQSVWFKNTGVLPAAVFFDAGLRGEYEGTETIVQALEAKQIYGKVFNRVIIPKVEHGKTTFTEADIVAVTTNGIHVFEIKNINGTINGNVRSPNWSVDYPNGNSVVLRNPFLQNQGHINYLVEYLYEHMDRNAFHSDSPLMFYCANVVMFNRETYTDQQLIGDLYDGCSYTVTNEELPKGYYSFMDQASDHLTRAQVDQICELIRPLADHSAEEYERMINERTEREAAEQKDKEVNPEKYRYPSAQYCAVHFDSYGSCVMRSNGDYTTVDYLDDGLFRAFPEMKTWRVLAQSDWRPGETGQEIAQQTAAQWNAQ